VRTLFAENKVRFARAGQLWSAGAVFIAWITSLGQSAYTVASQQHDSGQPIVCPVNFSCTHFWCIGRMRHATSLLWTRTCAWYDPQFISYMPSTHHSSR